MQLSDKLQIQINNLRGRALELAQLEKPAQADRQEIGSLKTEMRSLSDRLELALQSEGSEKIDLALTGDRSEDREAQRLFGAASLGNYMIATYEDRSLVGAEAELNAAFELGGPRDFPLRMLALRDDEMPGASEEQRVDALTSLTISTMITSGNWLTRMLAMSNAAAAGVTMRSVGQGEVSYPYVGGTQTAFVPSKGTATDAVAGTVTTKTHTPRAAQARYLVAREDQLKLGNSYDAALRADLRGQVTSAIDNFVFADSTDGMLVTVPAASGDAALSAASTFKQMQSGVLSAIDGIYAMEIADLSLSIRPAVYAYAGAIAPTSTDAFFTDYLKSMGCVVRANAHIAEISGQAGESYAIASKGRGIQGSAILSVWESGTMQIDSTGSNLAKRQVVLDIAAFFDFDVIRAASFYKYRIAVS